MTPKTTLGTRYMNVFGTLLTALSAVALPGYSALAADLPAFSAEDVFEMEYANDPQVSPDGSRVAYVRSSMDIMTDRTRRSIWVIALWSVARGHWVHPAGHPRVIGWLICLIARAKRSCSCSGSKAANQPRSLLCPSLRGALFGHRMVSTLPSLDLYLHHHPRLQKCRPSQTARHGPSQQRL
jgi:hypothetical protein